jgi:hypothetical protein
VGKPIVYEFAEIDSREEIVVHLGNLAEPDDLTLLWLSDLLEMPTRQIVECLALDNNIAVARTLYTSLCDWLEWTIPAGFLPGVHDDIHLPTSSSIDDDDELCQHLMMLFNAVGHQPEQWVLPRRDLYLPLSVDLLHQLAMLYQTGPSPKKIVRIGRVEEAAGDLDVFEHYVKQLERAIEAKFAGLGEGGSHAEVFAGIQLTETVLDLQRRHWKAEKARGMIDDAECQARLAGLDPLESDLRKLGDDVWEDFSKEYIEKEREFADKLLDLLDPSKGPPALHRAIELTCTNRQGLAPRLLDRVFELTERACNALARSDRADRFVREHVIDIFEEMGRELSPAAKEMLEGAGHLGEDTIEKWSDAIAIARAGLGDHNPGTSPVRYLGYAVRAYRTGLSALNSLLEHGVVAQVFTSMGLGSGGHAEFVSSSGRLFALMLLRSLANSAVQHRHKGNDLFVAGAPQFKKILDTLSEIDDEMAKSRIDGKAIGRQFWTDQGAKIRQLQVRTLPRSFEGATVRTAVSLMALFLSIGSNERDTGAYWTSIVSATISVGEHVARTWEFLHVFPQDSAAAEKVVLRLDRTVRVLSGFAGILSGVAAGFRMRNAWRRGRTGLAIIEGASMASSFACGVASFMMLSKGAWMLRVGAILNAWGVGIGTAAFIALIVYDHYVDVGTRPVFRSLLRTLRELDKMKSRRAQMDAILERVDEVENSLSAFREVAGDRNDAPTRGAPTVWKTAKLGFSLPAIVKMFDSGPVFVETALVGFPISSGDA